MNMLMKILPIFLIVAGAVIIVSSVSMVENAEEPQEEFCGISTNGTCESDLECIETGCSGSTCQSKNEEEMMTTCEWKECYDNEKYGLSCQCIEGKCTWAK